MRLLPGGVTEGSMIIGGEWGVSVYIDWDMAPNTPTSTVMQITSLLSPCLLCVHLCIVY